MATTATLERRGFEQPDDKLDFGIHGHVEVVRLGDGVAGTRGSYAPGWKWSVDQKPLVGSPDACPLRHIGYCVRGRMTVRMETSGKETPPSWPRGMNSSIHPRGQTDER